MGGDSEGEGEGELHTGGVYGSADKKATAKADHPWKKCLRVGNISRYATRNDAVRFFQNRVPLENIRIEYSDDLGVAAWWVGFESEIEWKAAMRAALVTHTSFRPRIVADYSVDVMRRETNKTVNQLLSRGRGGVVLADGIESGASIADCLTFLSGYEMSPLPVTLLVNPSQGKVVVSKTKDGHRRALFSMMSVEEAHRLVRERNFAFIGNHRVHLRVLQ